jgi:YggT family protein
LNDFADNNMLQISAACASSPFALHVARSQSITSGIMVNPFFWLILSLLNIYFYVILITVIMSWLIGFNVINGANPYVRQISYALHRLTEPLLGPIRRFLPDLGGIDISPIILIIALLFLERALIWWVFPLFL